MRTCWSFWSMERSLIIPVGTGEMPGMRVAQFGITNFVSTLRVSGSITAMYSVPPFAASHVAALLQVGIGSRKRCVARLQTGASGVPFASGNDMVPRIGYGLWASMNVTYEGSAVCVVRSSGFGFTTMMM